MRVNKIWVTLSKSFSRCSSISKYPLYSARLRQLWHLANTRQQILTHLLVLF